MGPPTRSRREERRDETREELVASAAAVFAERGFHGASLEQIAREAGYSTGAIYWHFGGKDELFLAAFETYALTRVGEFAEISEAGSGRLPERARAFADHWMARHASNPGFLLVSLEFLAHAWRKPHLLKAFAAQNAAIRLALARILEQEAQTAGAELPMPAQDLATVMRQLGVGLALAKLAESDAFPDRLYGDFVELFYELATSDEPRRTPDAMGSGRE